MSVAVRPDKTMLANWIGLYEKHRRRLDKYLKHFENLPIEKGIRDAAQGKDQKIHPHQYRVGADKLREIAEILVKHADRIKACDSFDALHNLVAELASGIERFGELAIYDTALRLSFCLSPHCPPKDVYLHAGARDGWRQFKYWGLISAEAVDGKLRMSDLPELSDLVEAYHVENFLCIFKEGEPKDGCDPRDGDPMVC